MRRGLLVGTSLVVLAAAIWLGGKPLRLLQPDDPSGAFSTITERPSGDRRLYDHAGLLTHFREGVERYLASLTRRYHIESIIVTLPSIPRDSDIDEVAAGLLNRWRIGQEFDGRAVVLVLVADRQQVRMEIGYELEDVYTDAFVGYVEDKQLQPYFANDDIGTGLIALMEELERRAELKQQGAYTAAMIARLDSDFMSGGGGAARDLTQFNRRPQTLRPAGRTGQRGARTPGEAWRTLLAKWAGQGAELDLEVYTELTRMEMGDPDRPDPRTREALPHWQNAEFEVLQDGDHAVIYFGRRKGWDNAPFLFCRDDQGWKFDIVHQRRLVVMGSGQSWFVEQGSFPYVSLFGKLPQSTGKDLPLAAADRYHCHRDRAIAERIRALSAQLDKTPDDYAALRELLRLNVITGRRPNHVQPLLRRARALAPEDPLPYKYSAIYHVNTFFQYESALGDVAAYFARGGEPLFGYQLKGFLHYRLRQYDEAAAAFERALDLQPDDVYALTSLVRVYALQGLQYPDGDPRRQALAARTGAYLRRAQNTPATDHDRVRRVAAWVKAKGL